MERVNLKKLEGKTIGKIVQDYQGNIAFYEKEGQRLLTVKIDSLFDDEGNYFDTTKVPYVKRVYDDV